MLKKNIFPQTLHMDAILLKIKTKSRSTVLSLMRKISLKTESPPIKIETSLLVTQSSDS